MPLRSSYCPELLQLYVVHPMEASTTSRQSGSIFCFSLETKEDQDGADYGETEEIIEAIIRFGSRAFLSIDSRAPTREKRTSSKGENPFTEEVDSVSIDLDLRVMRYIEEQTVKRNPLLKRHRLDRAECELWLTIFNNPAPALKCRVYAQFCPSRQLLDATATATTRYAPAIRNKPTDGCGFCGNDHQQMGYWDGNPTEIDIFLTFSKLHHRLRGFWLRNRDSCDGYIFLNPS